MAIRVYRIAVVGCPRAVVEPIHDGTFTGVGKSCFCNRFVKPSAYTETHNSIVSSKKWMDHAEIGGDHFLYWGATTRHIQDGSKARFQVVEQTEFYEIAESGEDLQSHPSDSAYIDRATSVRFSTSSYGKVAVRLKAEQSSARVGGLRSTTQIFPNEDFAGKNGGVMGYACIFDPTLTEEQMKRQMVYLTDLLQALSRRKKKVVLVCTKCDEGDENQIKLGASLAACALRKPVPFFEVSSRDDINIEDVFYSLIGHAKKSPKIPRTPKSPKSLGRHFSVSANTSYKDALTLRKHDIHRTKDAYRRLLQKKIVTFSTTWSEAYRMLEKEEEFSDLLKLAGKDGNETVKNMFCLRLIEIKLTEAAKLYGLSSATKKLNKGKLQEYQRYISDALKNHTDLRDESVYDYVYSPGSVDDPSHSHQTSFSSDNTSGARSNCNTPDHQPQPSVESPDASSQQLGGHTHSLTMPDLSERNEPVTNTAHHSVELLSTYSPHRAPLTQNTQDRFSNVYTYSSNSHLLESASVDESDMDQLLVSRSHPILDVTPPPPPLPLSQRLGLDRRRSNSMGSVTKSPRLSRVPSSDSVDVLNAEPYLQPVEVQMVMHTLPRTQKLPESTSYHSIHEEAQHMSTSHRQIPLQTSAVEISRTLTPSRHELMQKLGHRRTASNPWVLEGNRELPLTTKLPPSLPPPLSPLVPPVPARDYHRTSTSPPLLSSAVLDPHESSLDFSLENRRLIASASLSPMPQTQPQYADIDDIDKLSTISGPFEEISDDPDSSAEMTDRTPKKSDKSGTNSAANSQSRLVKKKSSTLNSDYEMIEEYITMAPTSTFPRRSILNSDTPNKPTTTPKKTTVVPSPVKAKKQKSGWSRQSTDSVIPDAATIRSSSPPLFPTNRRFTMLDSSQRNSTASNIRPLPPSPSKSVGSPTKAVRSSVSRNSSNSSNIYETIDEEMLSRVYSRRRGSGLPKWAPPVAPKHYAQYLVILRKFFTDPHIVEAWEKTVREIIPGGDVATYPPPYSNLAKNQPKRLGPTVEVPMPREGSAEPDTTTKTNHQVNHTRHDSHDQYVLPMLTPQKTQPQASSTPATPAPTREGMTQKAGAFSSPRARYAANRPNSRENLIELLNMSAFNQADSSESGSSDSEESDDDESDEREEEEEGESEEGEVEDGRVEGMVTQGGDGMLEGGDGEARDGKEKEGREMLEEEELSEAVGTVESIKNEPKDETDDVIAITGVIDHDRQSPPPLQSPNQNLEDEFDSILTNLNPILNAFGSILADNEMPLDSRLTTEAAPITTSDAHDETHTHDPTHISPRESDPGTSAPVSTHSPQRQCDSVLRASVSTDSDLDSTSLIKPSSLFSKNKIKRTAPPIPKKKPTRRREQAVIDGLSDSGISNCHSQTFDDGFNPLDNN